LLIYYILSHLDR